MKKSGDYNTKALSGRNRRLLYEWRKLEERLNSRPDIRWQVTSTNAEGLPISYRVDYDLRSICGVEHLDRLEEQGLPHTPLFANHFVMQITLPAHYPCIDAQPSFCFLTEDEKGEAIPHPWHPNIRYFGQMAGRVCINMADSYTDLAWGVERVAHYLRYDTYHAINEPPYPEDLKVASWVVNEGEPNEWIFFSQNRPHSSKENNQ